MPSGWLQLALAVRDAECNGGVRRALVALRDAAALAIEELDRPPLATPTPEPEPTLPPAPPSLWARLAAEWGEPVLVLNRESLPTSGTRGCMEYCVAESRATAWEKANQIERVEP